MIMTTKHMNVECAANSELYSSKESELWKNRRKGGKKKPEGHFYTENTKNIKMNGNVWSWMGKNYVRGSGKKFAYRLYKIANFPGIKWLV